MTPPKAPAAEVPTIPDWRGRWQRGLYGAWALLAVFAIPKGLSLLVPRRRRLVVFGAGLAHVDNVIGILSAQPGPPPGTVIRVLAAPEHRKDPRLVAAVAALPRAKILRTRSPAAAWACLRAGWVLVSYNRIEAWRFWLGRARLVYINHGPWMKRMSSPLVSNRAWRFYRAMYGRFHLVLASTPEEIPDYQAWLGRDVEVVCLGYPRSPVLDVQRQMGSNPHKVGVWPTWIEFADPSYSRALAQRMHAALVAAGVTDACVEYKPHFLSKTQGLTLGPDDGRLPNLVVTDFSSVSFDQFYRGGKVILYSLRLEEYLARRGLRPGFAPWLRRQMVQDEDELLRRVVAVVQGRGRGATDPLDLQPFDSAAFWRKLGVA